MSEKLMMARDVYNRALKDISDTYTKAIAAAEDTRDRTFASARLSLDAAYDEEERIERAADSYRPFGVQ